MGLPVAFWTGRLPGLSPLPGRVLLFVLWGLLLTSGFFARLDVLASSLILLASVSLMAWRHYTPTGHGVGRSSARIPGGPDEKLVAVEVWKGEWLLGWDTGMLWFEAGGFGFAGQAMTIVVPRNAVAILPNKDPVFGALRRPSIPLQIGDVRLLVTPLSAEMSAHQTLARIENLHLAGPTSPPVLPPQSIHPELTVRRRTSNRRRVFWIVVLPLSAWLTQSGDPVARAAALTSLVIAVAFLLRAPRGGS